MLNDCLLEITEWKLLVKEVGRGRVSGGNLLGLTQMVILAGYRRKIIQPLLATFRTENFRYHQENGKQNR